MTDLSEGSGRGAEPIFVATRHSAEFQAAYDRAAETLPLFTEYLQEGGDALYSVKLRFRDPNESERLGRDCHFFLWLTSVSYDPGERLFSGTFFEVPAELRKWHQVGDRLAFDPEDIFDWMVLREGRLHGGFALRVSRSLIHHEEEREAYDRYLGVSFYEPLPES